MCSLHGKMAFKMRKRNPVFQTRLKWQVTWENSADGRTTIRKPSEAWPGIVETLPILPVLPHRSMSTYPTMARRRRCNFLIWNYADLPNRLMRTSHAGIPWTPTSGLANETRAAFVQHWTHSSIDTNTKTSRQKRTVIEAIRHVVSCKKTDKIYRSPSTTL